MRCNIKVLKTFASYSALARFVCVFEIRAEEVSGLFKETCQIELILSEIMCVCGSESFL
jgi:hypothetical protein